MSEMLCGTYSTSLYLSLHSIMAVPVKLQAELKLKTSATSINSSRETSTSHDLVTENAAVEAVCTLYLVAGEPSIQ